MLDDAYIGAIAGGAYGLGAFSLLSYLALMDDPQFQAAPLGEKLFAVGLPGAIYGALGALVGAAVVALLPFEVY